MDFNWSYFTGDDFYWAYKRILRFRNQIPADSKTLVFATVYFLFIYEDCLLFGLLSTDIFIYHR